MSLIFAAVFIPLGVNVPYFPLWLEAKGFGPEEIAVILSAPIFLRVVTTPFISGMADRAKDRANVLVAISVAAFLLSLGYFLTPTYAVVLAVTLALNVFWSPQSPLADSLALSGVRRFGSNYPQMRIWGSLAFLGGNFLGGMILAATSADAVPAMISFGLFATLAAALITPRMGRPRVASPLSAAGLQEEAASLFNLNFLFFVSGAGVGAVLRWVAFPLIEPLGLGVPGFFAVQTLHALSTGLLLIGLQKMIGETVPEERTGAAQGIAFFANGLSMGVVTLACGPLYTRLGGDGFYVMAAIALVGLALIGMAALSPEITPRAPARAARPESRGR